jgi:hypothetical protein
VPANETRGREAARTCSFDGAQTLAAALMDCDACERWEPLRDLILAGLEAGGMRHGADSTALRTPPSQVRRGPPAMGWG